MAVIADPLCLASPEDGPMNRNKMILLVLGALAVTLFFVLDLGRFLTLASLKANRQALLDFYSAHRLLTVAGFMTIYIVQTALSLPGAAILSLAAGAVFGSIMGTVYANIAATIGATLAFLVTRYLLRDIVLSRFGAKLEGINRELESRGFNYLLFLRLVPLFPFFPDQPGRRPDPVAVAHLLLRHHAGHHSRRFRLRQCRRQSGHHRFAGRCGLAPGFGLLCPARPVRAGARALLQMEKQRGCERRVKCGKGAWCLGWERWCTKLNLFRGHGPLLPVDAIPRSVGAGHARDVRPTGEISGCKERDFSLSLEMTAKKASLFLGRR